MLKKKKKCYHHLATLKLPQIFNLCKKQQQQKKKLYLWSIMKLNPMSLPWPHSQESLLHWLSDFCLYVSQCTWFKSVKVNSNKLNYWPSKGYYFLQSNSLKASEKTEKCYLEKRIQQIKIRVNPYKKKFGLFCLFLIFDYF